MSKFDHIPDKFGFYTGWSEGDGVTLMRRDPATGRRIKERFPVDWYFCISDEDRDKIPEKEWASVLKRVEKVERSGSYWKIFVPRETRSFNMKRVYDGIGEKENWAKALYSPEPCWSFSLPQDRDRWVPIHGLIDYLQRIGIEPLEADLTPLRRFLVDEDVPIQEEYSVCYFDFETDDRSGSFEHIEGMRVLSVAWEAERPGVPEPDRGFLALEDDTDESEKRFLKEFVGAVKGYDVLAAWNGFGFDFPILFARCHEMGLKVDWRKFLYADPLPVFRKRYLRQQMTSYALDSVGERVLGVRKIDWRGEFAAKHPGVPPTFFNLWTHDRELLERYNRLDVEIMRRLEGKTAFLAIERAMNRAAGIFVGDFTVSNKIDVMLMRRASRNDIRYATAWRVEKPKDKSKRDKYVGAYVFPPKVGMYTDVGVFDFKSLYPSMIKSFNISPETHLKDRSEESLLRHERICVCPEVETDRGVKGGAVYKTDKQGMMSQLFTQTTERRGEYQKLQKKRIEEVKSKDDPLVRLYDNMAYAWKSLGLSMYGVMGHQGSRYYDVEMAESITLSGQHFIKKTEEVAKSHGYKVIYGDTDSVFITLAKPDDYGDEEQRRALVLRRGEKLLEDLQSCYAEELASFDCRAEWGCVQLEFEDVYDRIVIGTKKRYAGRMLLSKGSAVDHVEVKGFECVRSDNSERTRRLQREVLEAIFKSGATAADIERNIISKTYEEVKLGKLPLADVRVSKSISKALDKYKANSLHVRLAKQMQDAGREFYVGMKVEYVVTDGSKEEVDPKTKKKTKKQEGALVQDYEAKRLSYDPTYYWDKMIFPATHRILKICFPDHDWDRWSESTKRRRKELVDRFTKWMRTGKPADIQRAVDRIRENRGGVLGPDELQKLRGVWRSVTNGGD